MKQLTVLPLMAIISGLMVGCGGGGGGGSSAPAKTTFSFSFATPNKIDETAANIASCTVYDRVVDGNNANKLLTYQPAIDGQLTGDKVVGF